MVQVAARRGVRRGVPRVAQRSQGREFFQRLAKAGDGDFVEHRGQMMESVLLSVLDDTVSWERGERGYGE